MKIRTAIFAIYVAASALGFSVLMFFVLRDVRLRYIESMRRTLGDTAALLAGFVQEDAGRDDTWTRKLAALPAKPDLLRVFACDASGRVLFDAAGGDVGRIYEWPMRGGGRIASENYTVSNVAIVAGELRVAAPVRRDGVLVGWVGVGRPLTSVSEGVQQARWELITSSCLVALAMTAAGWWLATRLTGSIERLTGYAQAVRAGVPTDGPPASRAAEIAALGQAFEEMRQALEGKAYVERYTQALAHEFKAPLSSIRGAAELLAENPPAEDRVRFLANLRAESERLQRIVERLLELAALEARRARAALTELELAAVLRGVHTDAQPRASVEGVTLALRIDANPRVHGEEFLLAQAIGNLVQNALDFTPRGGTVTVTLALEAGQARVCVDDTGPGVPDYALERIFDRFYSLPRPATGRKSSGLGLSIVREIARLHGGEITLVNRPEGGASACLTLPAV